VHYPSICCPAGVLLDYCSNPEEQYHSQLGISALSFPHLPLPPLGNSWHCPESAYCCSVSSPTAAQCKKAGVDTLIGPQFWSGYRDIIHTTQLVVGFYVDQRLGLVSQAGQLQRYPEWSPDDAVASTAVWSFKISLNCLGALQVLLCMCTGVKVTCNNVVTTAASSIRALRSWW